MIDVYAFTVTRANTAPRAKLLLNTLTQARETAKYDFFWHVITQRNTLAADILESAFQTKLINALTINDDNVGQHVAWNMAIDNARKLSAKYFLRLDDDVEFVTKGWLDRLVELSIVNDDAWIISPTVKGLTNPPPRSEVGEVKGYRVEFLTEAIGGICRFHPMALLDHPEHPFVADVRRPLGGGDALAMGAWCLEHIIPMVYAKHIRVKHAHSTEGQLKDDAEHFRTHDLFFNVPYVPTWTSATNC